MPDRQAETEKQRRDRERQRETERDRERQSTPSQPLRLYLGERARDRETGRERETGNNQRLHDFNLLYRAARASYLTRARAALSRAALSKLLGRFVTV